MTDKERIEYEQLEAGFRFPPVYYTLDTQTVAAYCEAVEEERGNDEDVVLPMAIAALSMAAFVEGISLPDGAVHISQEIEFIDTVKTGTSIVNHSHVSRKQKRSKFHMLTVDMDVEDESGRPVMMGKCTFLLPQNKDK